MLGSGKAFKRQRAQVCSRITQLYAGGLNMEAKEKKQYVKEWEDYISGCNALLWVSDHVLEDEVRTAMATLKALVPRVADNKIAHTKVSKLQEEQLARNLKHAELV